MAMTSGKVKLVQQGISRGLKVPWDSEWFLAKDSVGRSGCLGLKVMWLYVIVRFGRHEFVAYGCCRALRFRVKVWMLRPLGRLEGVASTCVVRTVA